MKRCSARGTARRNGMLLAIFIGYILSSCSPAFGPATGTRRAIIAGINSYHIVNDLKYCVNDANGVYDMLLAQGWASEEIELLLDDEATKTNVLEAFAGAAAELNAEGTFFFYYSGHGTSTADLKAIMPQALDTDVEQGFAILSDAGQSSISSSWMLGGVELAAKLNELPTKKRIVVMDSCYSGSFISSGRTIDIVPPDASELESVSGLLGNSLLIAGVSMARYFWGSTAQDPAFFISASGADEKSYETPYAGKPDGHGYFTKWFLLSPQYGDSNGDSLVSASEAYSFAVYGLINLEGLSEGEFYYPRVSGGDIDYVLMTARK